ncbi:MAG: DUF4924 family protein [Dysgonamonadaceae bacterium]|jgi:hypothetical protein|nr:DUF4924 family protein [Dysgonamonadaceae bacterium]
MFVAKQKKKENIAEYLLYMWQLEDILRACGLDVEQVYGELVAPTNRSDEEKQEARFWYDNLIAMMKLEGVQKGGHLQINKNLLADLNDFHLQLLKDPEESVYIVTYSKTLSFIVELRAKSENKDVSEMETCFTALYGYLLLKLQRKDISGETQAAVARISNLLRLLSKKYKTRYKKI